MPTVIKMVSETIRLTEAVSIHENKTLNIFSNNFNN